MTVARSRFGSSHVKIMAIALILPCEQIQGSNFPLLDIRIDMIEEIPEVKPGNATTGMLNTLNLKDAIVLSSPAITSE